jgi:hypothetical protein
MQKIELGFISCIGWTNNAFYGLVGQMTSRTND